MKILHTISSIDKNSGGTSTYLQLLANELVKHVPTVIAAIQSKEPLSLKKKVEFYAAANSFPYIQGFSIQLRNYLTIIETDIFHGNGMWEYPVHEMVIAAKKRKIPYVFSPHGMLEPWPLSQRKWLKKLALLLFQFNDLAQANCIHATAKIEADNLRKLGFENPIAVIPNGINLSEFSVPENKQEKSKQTVLFLSRIHPKKGIEMLIEAWELLNISMRQNWQIEIAGNGEAAYISTLQQLINSKGLSDGIRIIGPQFGSDKLATYQRADLFVLPTYSENFGIVVAEAMACGVPVITTKGTPWEELNTNKAGWWIDIGIEPLVEALILAFQLSETERQQMGQNGRKLVEENYSIESVAQKMIQLYEWILNGGEKPEFVD